MSLESTKVAEAVETIMTTMLGLKATVSPANAGNSLRPSILTGCVQITGAWQGAVTVECSCGLARRMAAIMFSSDACDISSDQVNDALGELTNIIGGNIKAFLPEPSHLSMPAVADGSDYFFSVPGSRPMAKLSFSCEGKPLDVTVLESNR